MYQKHRLLNFLLIFSYFFATAQTPSYNLFTNNGAYQPSGKGKEVVSGGTKLVLNKAVLQYLNDNRAEEIELEIPLEKETITLQLKKVNLFSYNRADVVLASTLKQYQYSPGYYLRGKVKGRDKSLAAISIFDNSIGGIISFNNSNHNLCIANNENDYSSNDYILYSDNDFHGPVPKCFVDEDFSPARLKGNKDIVTDAAGCPIDMYFELGNKMYSGQGYNVKNTLNYFTTIFNGIQAIYANERIVMQIREIKLWDLAEPEYFIGTSSGALSSFSARMRAGFNGDLAHYVTYNSLGGGLAYLDVLCMTNASRRTGVCGNLVANNQPFPNYSFTINGVTHEIGHNLGSPHTHSCTWQGGPIDNCAPIEEGPCTEGPRPPLGGGTIMSYCHLINTVKIDFANGFGPLPGDLIRDNIKILTFLRCICECSNIVVDITTQDIGCGSSSGSATVNVTDGAGPFTYKWSNGETTQTISNLAAGTYYVTVKGTATDCSVIKACKIINQGNALSITTSPSATSISKCLNETHDMAVSVSPQGAYTYQWYKDNQAITGETNDKYTARVTGVYHAEITNGTCVGKSRDVNVTIQNITPFSVTANGVTSICDNDSVALSVPSTAYSIEWNLNGSTITGATASTYYAKQAGDYTARLFSPGNATCSASSAPVTVQVKPAPVAVIAPQGNIAVCKGGQVPLTHNAVNGNTFQWYKDGAIITGATQNNFSAFNTGKYLLEVKAANGCAVKSIATTVTVDPLPDSAITPAGTTTLCNGGTLTLKINASGDNTYQWFNGTQPVSSGPSAELTVSVSGSYHATIKNTITGCSSTSPVAIVNLGLPPIIFAGNDTVLATGQPYHLHAIEITNLGVNRFEWSPATGLDNPFTANPVATLYADQQYIVKGIHPSGCFATDSIKIKVFKGPAIYIPGAFSPDGDGLNDVLKCVAVGLRQFNYFEVYNRLGQKLFSTSNLNKGWDGRYQGVPVNTGTYIWRAEAIDYTGKKIQQQGTVTVIR